MLVEIKVNLSSCASQEAYLRVLTLPPGRVRRVIYTVCRQRGLRFTANSGRVAWSDVRLWPITLTAGRFMTVTAILLPLSPALRSHTHMHLSLQLVLKDKCVRTHTHTHLILCRRSISTGLKLLFVSYFIDCFSSSLGIYWQETRL